MFETVFPTLTADVAGRAAPGRAERVAGGPGAGGRDGSTVRGRRPRPEPALAAASDGAQAALHRRLARRPHPGVAAAVQDGGASPR